MLKTKIISLPVMRQVEQPTGTVRSVRYPILVKWDYLKSDAPPARPVGQIHMTWAAHEADGTIITVAHSVYGDHENWRIEVTKADTPDRTWERSYISPSEGSCTRAEFLAAFKKAKAFIARHTS